MGASGQRRKLSECFAELNLGGGQHSPYFKNQLTIDQYRIIYNQQEKSICQIQSKNLIATGFLCSIPNPVLITNNHVLNSDQLKVGEKIKLSFLNENDEVTSKIIKIDKKRNIYTVGKLNGEDIDTTIIELRPDEDGLNDKEFMEIDEKLMSDEIKEKYEKKDIYTMHFRAGELILTSIGVINKIIKDDKSYTILHTCDSDFTSSGSPIILYNHKIIGVHRGFFLYENDNRATLLQYPIKEYIKKFGLKKLKKKNNRLYRKNNFITNVAHQAEKSLCLIKLRNIFLCGFLCRIPSPVLITTNQILNDNDIKDDKKIEIELLFSCGKTRKRIKIDKNRNIYNVNNINGAEINMSIIELRPEEDSLSDKEFLEIDEHLMKDQINEYYKGKDMYMIYYSFGKKGVVTNGKINEIRKQYNTYEIVHNCETGYVSYGGPIFLSNNKLIGFQKGYILGNKIKKGILLQSPIMEFNKKLENRSIA